ncbi:MAG: exodeoxyribonuclease VII large subunit [Tepidimonas sp.]|nr:exodeoxyribonuclease VII large subunit [Tepidimonas sp.]
MTTARPTTPPDSSEQVPAVWSVGALVAAVADALRVRFNPVQVVGEVAGCTRAASGHTYFTLKDEQGQLRCALFRRVADGSGVTLRDGLRVQVSGRLDVYAPRGDLQLIVERVRPAGLGNLYEQFLRLKAQLQAEGLFEAARKRPLPPYPQCVGVVTSLDAAALRDVATTLARRVPHLPVRLYPAAVQGAQAPAQLCAALQQAYRDFERLGVPQVLLLVRGGGSLEDLWAFNDPQLVRTVARAPMPVICGVGHETDVTLADFAADLRAPTPTAAAELCAPARAELEQALQRLHTRLREEAWRRLDERAQRLDRIAARLGRPSQRLAQQRQRLLAVQHRWQLASQALLQRQRQRLQGGQQRLQTAAVAQLTRQRLRWQAWVQRLAVLPEARRVREEQRLQALQARWPRAVQVYLQGQTLRLQHWQAQLDLLDPQRVLQRGYALVTDADGHVVVQAAQLRPGQDVQVRLAHGAFAAEVRQVEPHAPPR